MTHLTDEQLNEYLDTGTLVDRYTRTHLDACSDCRARIEELRAVFTMIESLPEAKLSRDLTASILAQIKPAWGGMAFRPTPWKWIFAAQTIGALAIAAWLSSSFELPTEIFAYQPPTLDSLVASFLVFLSSFSFELSSFEIHLSSFIFDLSSFNLTFLIVSAAALWLVGNGLLLRAPARRSG